MVLEFDGDDSSTTTADVSELQLQIEGAAEEKVDNVIAVGRSIERVRWYGGRGEPRRPASGQAGPLAHAGLSRGGLSQARGSPECLWRSHGRR